MKKNIAWVKFVLISVGNIESGLKRTEEEQRVTIRGLAGEIEGWATEIYLKYALVDPALATHTSEWDRSMDAVSCIQDAMYQTLMDVLIDLQEGLNAEREEERDLDEANRENHH